MAINHRIKQCTDQKAFFNAQFELCNGLPASPVHFITDHDEELIVSPTEITRIGREENLNFCISGNLRKANAPIDDTKPFFGYYNAKKIGYKGKRKKGVIGAFTVTT